MDGSTDTPQRCVLTFLDRARPTTRPVRVLLKYALPLPQSAEQLEHRDARK